MAKSEGVSLGVTLVKLVFTLVKVTFAWATGSLVLIVESMHSAANVMTSLGVWWSLRLERQRAEGILEEQDVSLQRGANWEADADSTYRDWRTQRYIKIKTRWEKKLAVLAGFILMALAVWGMWTCLQPPDWGLPHFQWLRMGQWTNSGWIVPVVMLFLGLLTYFISRMEQQVGSIEGQKDFAAGSVRAKLDALGCLLVVAVFSLKEISSGAIDLNVAVGLAIAAVLLMQGLEIIASAMMSQFEEQRIADFQEWDAEIGVGKLSLGRLLSGSGWLSFFGFLSRGVAMQTGQQRPLRFLYRHLPIVLGIALLVFLVQSSFFVVQPQEVAFVERLGQTLGIRRQTVKTPDGVKTTWEAATPLTEGLHMKLPWPIDNVVRIPKYEVRSRAFGFAEAPKKVPFIIYEPQFHDVEVELITKPPKLQRTSSGARLQTSNEPGYLIVMTLRVQYEIGNVAAYYGGTRTPDEVLDTETNYLLLTWARRKTVNELLTIDQDEITGDIRRKLNQRLTDLNTGLHVRSVVVLWIHPPVREGTHKGGPPVTVAKAYQLVAAAREDYKRRVLEAIGNRNKILPEARAKATALIEAARAYRETVGRRSDLLVLKPSARLGTVIYPPNEKFVFFALHHKWPKLLPVDDGLVGKVTLQYPPDEPDDPRNAIPNVVFPGHAPRQWPRTKILTTGSLVQVIPRAMIVENAPVRNLDLVLLADGRRLIGTLTAKIEGKSTRTLLPHGGGEPIIFEADLMLDEGPQKTDLVTVRPPSEQIECRILDEEDEKFVTVAVDYEYIPGPATGKLPRIEKIHKSRIAHIARGGVAGRLSHNQGIAAAFVVLADAYNQEHSYKHIFRNRRRQAAVREALSDARKIVLGRRPVEIWYSLRNDPLEALSGMESDTSR